MTSRLRLPSLSVTLCIVAGFFVASFIVYGQSLKNEFVTWDDHGLIVENQNVKAINAVTLKNVFTSYDPELYIPLTFVSYQIDHLIGGTGPFIYHFTNLVLHTFNALLVAWLFSLLLGNGWLALGLGALFLLHPLNAEAVAWASSRKDTLSTFFFLASLVSYVLWRHEQSIKKFFVMSIALFLLGLLSKVMVLTLPIVLFLFDLLENRKPSVKLLVEKSPYLVLSLLFGIIGLFGKTDIVAASTFLQKVIMACRSTIFYLQKFFLPTGLSFAYPYTDPIVLSSVDFAIPVALFILFLGFIVWLWRKNRLASVGLLFFVVTLVPTFINFAKGGDFYFASDRYAYIPMVGLLLAVGSLLSDWNSSKTRFISGGFIIISCIFGVFAAKQALTWSSSSTLYLHALELYPNSRAAHHNLGMEYLAGGDAQAALKELEIARSINNDPRTLVSHAAALTALNRLDEAEAEYQSVIKLYPDQPDSYYGIANIRYKNGKFQEAVEYYKKALVADPVYVNALNNLGGLYIELEDWTNAITTLKRSLELRPDFVESYYNLAGAYQHSGQLAEAEEMYRKALSMNGNDTDTLANLATVLYERGDIDGAAQLLQKALQIQSHNPTAVSLVLRMQQDGVAE